MSARDLSGVDRHDGSVAAEGWGGALVRGAAALIASFLGFVVVPDRLMSFLSVRVVPRARDGLVLLWVVVFFVFDCWLLIQLQRRGRRALRG